jgi:xanthine/CO dehydrogenase XdhC/CoxF family maturation factor
MLVCGDGNCVGSISGGCLEGDVTKKAVWWTAGREAVLRVYDTSSEEASWEFGLGCNGIISLLLERISDPSADEALAFLDSHRTERRAAVVAVAIRADRTSGIKPGDRLLWDEHGAQGGSLASSHRLAAEARAAFEDRQSRLLCLPEAAIFLEFVPAPQRLVIFGAGHDAIPVARLAAQMGWSVTVADGRPAYATQARFPDADRVAVLNSAANISHLEFDEHSAVVMMTHNFEQDKRLLRQVLRRRPSYLGLLGPKRRAELLFEEIGEPITAFNVNAPAGLDLGGDSPQAIALAIVSEVLSVLEGRPGGPLKWRRGPIHAVPSEARRESSADELVELTVCGNV